MHRQDGPRLNEKESLAQQLLSSDILDHHSKRFFDCLSDSRAQRVARVLHSRTRHLTIALEDVLGAHNCAAVLRTADAFGIQDVHMIRGNSNMGTEHVQARNSTRCVSKGAEKWLTLRKYASSTACVRELRKNGYRIFVSSLGDEAKPLEELDFCEKSALIFGNEVEGVTSQLEGMADERFVIQNVGFVESYNVSVAVSISLAHSAAKCIESLAPSQYQLTIPEKRDVLRSWLTPPRLQYMTLNDNDASLKEIALGNGASV